MFVAIVERAEVVDGDHGVGDDVGAADVAVAVVGADR